MPGKRAVKSTPRNSAVMSAHHHRWATRRTVGAVRALAPRRAVLVPTHNGKRVKLPKATSTSTPQSPSCDSTRGSFDAFFAKEQTTPSSRGSFDAFISQSTTTPGAGANKEAQVKSSIAHKLGLNPYPTPLLHHQQQQQLQQPHLLLDATEMDLLKHHGINPQDIELRPVHAYFADLSVPCKSLHNTIAHLFIAEQLWFKRYNNIKPTQQLHDLWELPENAQGDHWGDFMADTMTGLSRVDVDNVEPHVGTHSNNTKNILSMPLSEQHDFAQHTIAQLATHLHDQCTEWIHAVQGTNELDLFAELRYLSTSAPLAALTTTTTRPDQPTMHIPQSLTTLSHNSTVQYWSPEEIEANTTHFLKLPRNIALNHMFQHATHHRSQLLTVASQFNPENQVSVDFTTFYPEWEHIHSKAFRWA